MRSRILILVAAGFTLASFASANVTWTWNFAGSNGGSYTAGAVTNTVTASNGSNQSATVYAAQETTTGSAETTVTGTLSTTSTSTLSGLFQVDDNPHNNGEGIAPYNPSEGGTLSANEYNAFSAQLGLSDSTGTSLSNMLLINVGAVTNNEMLSFLLNAGVSGYDFNVWTYYGTSAPTSLEVTGGSGIMTEAASNVPVGTAMNSQNIRNAQSTYTTTQAGNLWVAIQADCEYLLLDQIGGSQPAATTPEPKFYALLLFGLLAVAVRMRHRFATA